MEPNPDRIAATCMRMALLNEPWHDLGYKGRPRYGAIFQRLLPGWKVALENKMLQQMIALFTAAYVLAFGSARDQQQQIVNAYLETPELVTAFGYPSRSDGSSDLNKSIDDYASLDRQNWHKILLRRLEVMNIIDRKIRAKLIVGCITFSRNVESLTAYLRETAKRNN